MADCQGRIGASLEGLPRMLESDQFRLENCLALQLLLLDVRAKCYALMWNVISIYRRCLVDMTSSRMAILTK